MLKVSHAHPRRRRGEAERGGEGVQGAGERAIKGESEGKRRDRAISARLLSVHERLSECERAL
eukprot:634727-Pleurochrysis_carterae.AAC.3